MSAVSKEVAEKEFNSWMEYKKIPAKKRESNKEYGEKIIEAICDGRLVLNEDFTFTQKLFFAVEDESGSAVVSTLNFKPRVKTETIHVQMNGVKPGDADRRVLAYIAALTGVPKALIAKLDTEDYDVCQSFAVFFL